MTSTESSTEYNVIDPASWVYKLNLECVDEEDGSMTIHIEWNELDPDLAYWTSLGSEGQEEFIMTALRNALEQYGA